MIFQVAIMFGQILVFLAAILNFVELNFAYVFLAAILKWNFGLHNSDFKFQTLELSTEI